MFSDNSSFCIPYGNAGCWVGTTRKLYYFKKKKNQTYIHTWHAGPGLKKIERDAGSGLTDKYVRYAQRDSKAIDLLLSNCRFWTQCFRSCFWYDGPIMEKGLPKNDLYFQDAGALRRMIPGNIMVFHGCKDRALCADLERKQEITCVSS